MQGEGRQDDQGLKHLLWMLPQVRIGATRRSKKSILAWISVARRTREVEHQSDGEWLEKAQAPYS